MKIILDVEPIVKLSCWKHDCKHSLSQIGMTGCKSKYVEINEEGKCAYFVKRRQDEK